MTRSEGVEAKLESQDRKIDMILKKLQKVIEMVEPSQVRIKSMYNILYNIYTVGGHN